jgi:cell division protease FtsH
MSWLGAGHLKDVVQAAGFEVAKSSRCAQACDSCRKTEAAPAEKVEQVKRAEPEPNKVFELAGRPELAAFFNEHIVDIILHRDRYKALGIEFPSAVILHGPPGCGKTFAVDRLVDFLGWPSFQIDASSVASPYIHETSKKVAQVFDKAMQNAPSVLVIDEMEAFLADREMGSGHHRVEEVAEFLRRIPEAVKNDVLIVAMTNRIDMIDPAIQRRGRFDHVIKVDFASETKCSRCWTSCCRHRHSRAEGLQPASGCSASGWSRGCCGLSLSQETRLHRRRQPSRRAATLRPSHRPALAGSRHKALPQSPAVRLRRDRQSAPTPS